MSPFKDTVQLQYFAIAVNRLIWQVIEQAHCSMVVTGPLYFYMTDETAYLTVSFFVAYCNCFLIHFEVSICSFNTRLMTYHNSLKAREMPKVSVG